MAQVPVALSSSKTSNMPKKCGKGGTAGGSGNKSSKSVSEHFCEFMLIIPPPRVFVACHLSISHIYVDMWCTD